MNPLFRRFIIPTNYIPNPNLSNVARICTVDLQSSVPVLFDCACCNALLLVRWVVHQKLNHVSSVQFNCEHVFTVQVIQKIQLQLVTFRIVKQINCYFYLKGDSNKCHKNKFYCSANFSVTSYNLLTCNCE